MSKIIIHNRSSIPDADCAAFVSKVIAGGRISQDGRCYCFASRFKVGDDRCFVYAKRTSSQTDTFYVCDDQA